MMRRNYLALGAFFVLLLFAIAPVYGATVTPGINAHAYLTTKTTSYEITIEQAQVWNYADLFDEAKGVHYKIAEKEGETVNLNAIVSNNQAVQFTVEVSWIIRYKVGSGSWSVLTMNTTKGVVNAFSSSVGQTETQNLKMMGTWVVGNQFHIGLHIKAYPTTNPADSGALAWSCWFKIISDSQATTPPPGDSTPTTPPPSDGTPTDGTTPPAGPSYEYSGLLSFFDPLAQAIGTTRVGAVVVLAVLCLCVFTVIVVLLTKEEEW